jgi:hypothetical protein
MDFLTLESFFKELEKRPVGAKFYRVDLHNHTPADQHFNCGNFPVETAEQKIAFAREYVRFASEKIDIIGITDHNSVDWLPEIQAAATEQGLIVFPGIEIGAEAGRNQIYFIVLFDPGTDAGSISLYLSALGLQPGKRFHPDGSPCLIQKNVEELLEAINQPDQSLRGLPIAAHVSSKNGLLQDMEGEQRILAYKHSHLFVVEIPDAIEDLPDFERNILRGKNNLYGNKSVACLNHSDGRGIDQVNPDYKSIGEKSTHIKLSRFNIEALHQAFIDFESRVRLETEYRDQSYPLLLGVIVENGFLTEKLPDGSSAPFVLRLNPNLNTLIGGRGAGKSALVEAIRFVFDLLARTDDTTVQSEKIQASTLPGHARVTVFYRMPKGETYAITRAKGETSLVYDMATGQRIDIRPDAILPGGLPVEIYGQREIFEISKDVSFQLNLIESYVSDELGDLRLREQELLNNLRTNGQSIININEEIIQAQQRLQELPGVRLELDRMEREKVSDQLEQKTRADREQMLLDQASQAISALQQRIVEFKGQYVFLEGSIPDFNQLQQELLPHSNLLQQQKSLLADIDRHGQDLLSRLEQDIQTIWKNGEIDRQKWQVFYHQIQTDYEKLQQTQGTDFSADRYLKLQSRKQVLQGIENEVLRRQRRLSDLKAKRSDLLQQLHYLRRKEIFPILAQKCHRLTESLQGNVRVKITHEGNRDAYAEKLKQLFSGRRIEQSVIQELSRTMATRDQYADVAYLVKAIRDERDGPSDENSILHTVYKVSKSYRERLARLEDVVFFELEAYHIPDLPEIALKVSGQYRSLNPPPGQLGLSTGQKSTAILSIILVERDAPLVIDQPEDDLDNEFIFREIVQTLRRQKERRQFIVATHNANIPVSGDAELIVLLKADSENGWVELSGSIDDPEIREPVEIILEGGKDAFLMRQLKYQLME